MVIASENRPKSFAPFSPVIYVASYFYYSTNRDTVLPFHPLLRKMRLVQPYLTCTVFPFHPEISRKGMFSGVGSCRRSKQAPFTRRDFRPYLDSCLCSYQSHEPKYI